MDSNDNVFDPLRDFAKYSARLVKRCHNPYRKDTLHMHSPPSSESSHVSISLHNVSPEHAINTVQLLQVERRQAEATNWIQQQRAYIITVIILMAGLAIGAGYNAPGGHWQDTSDGHIAGVSIWQDTNPPAFQTFVAVDATSIVASFTIIVMFLCGFKFNHKIYIWLFTALSWMSIGGVMCGYLNYLEIVANFFIFKMAAAVVIALLWFGVALLLAAGHLIRLIRKVVSSTPPEGPEHV